MSRTAPTMAELAHSGRLLVISDYDGVVAPIVNDPAAAHPDPAVKAALLRLAELHRTYVAVLSGRARASVVSLFGDAPGITIIGSHGAESDEPIALSAEQQTLLSDAIAALQRIAAGAEGSMVEDKPASVALHVRNADAAVRPGLLEAVRRGPGSLPGIRAVEGKEVIELLVLGTNKGDAVDALRRRFAPDRVIVLGDDVTDEDAFAVLGEPDLGIKVGPGDTIAGTCVDSPTEVADVLGELATLRAQALETGDGGSRPSR